MATRVERHAIDAGELEDAKAYAKVYAENDAARARMETLRLEPAKVDGGVVLKASSDALATLAGKWLKVNPANWIGSPSQLAEIKRLAASVLSQAE